MKTSKEKTAPVYDVAAQGTVFSVQRNGRSLMTPAGAALALPTQALAEAIADEWRAQGDKIVPATMPMTQLAATALDIVRKDREKIVVGLLNYVGSELLCHRVETPASLCAKQAEIWQPYLDWCEQAFSVCFALGCGVMPITQKPETVAVLRKVIESYDDLHLAGLSSAVDSAGSLILGLALAQGTRAATDIFTACELDAAHQAITWGDDPVTQARHTALRQDLAACEKWFGLLKK